MEYRPEAIYQVPAYVELEIGSDVILLDPERPHWLATDKRGRDLARLFNGQRTLQNVVSTYQASAAVDQAKAYLDVHTFIEDALHSSFIIPKAVDLTGTRPTPVLSSPYLGRQAYLSKTTLKELWIHTNNFCNLTCKHCLVSSSPMEDKGLKLDQLQKLIQEAYSLGVRRFYFTGGEPFARTDIFNLIHEVLNNEDTELVILTNATLFDDTSSSSERLEKLSSLPKNRLMLQVSLDGTTAEINDSIRGKGSYQRTLKGLQTLTSLGFQPTLTVVVTKTNRDDIPRMPDFVKGLGLSQFHLLWLHRRGRAMEFSEEMILSTPDLIEVVKKTMVRAREIGVEMDNFNRSLARLQNTPGEKFDLSMAGYESLCVYSDGTVYPSAALANLPELACGNILKRSLHEIWQTSPILKSFREASVTKKEICQDCHLKFICGGGDIEHSYYYSSGDSKKRTILGADPYCELHKFLYREAFQKILSEGLRPNPQSGFTAPFVFRFMGDTLKTNTQSNGHNGTHSSPETRKVHLSHSECVLTFHPYEGREKVRAFYKEAAVEPQAELCCPTKYDPADVGHIPQDVLDRFYGCGSPVSLAELREGETYLDLGCGAGIDVFTAAKKIGPSGQAIGVDMTDEMLVVAEKCQPAIEKNLGYANTRFHRGFLEELPIETQSVDCVTSNCVINLSVKKSHVFQEIWRVLKDHGRVVISDIVSETLLPITVTSNPNLWGECIGGALTEGEFIALLKKTGFYGLETLKKTFWKEVQGYPVFAITVRGYKFEKKAGCVYLGQYALYQGPFEATIDEEGHFFPRGQKVEICTDTFEKLSHPPYDVSFMILDVDEEIKKEWTPKQKANNGSSCGPGCC